MAPTPVDFFFDPGCPFTWRTSRWITAVAEAGAATVTWRLMSLGVLAEGKDVPEQYREPMRQGGRALRALAAAQELGGNDAVARLYTAIGTRKHDKGEPSDDASIAAAVAEAGLPASVAEAVDDAGRDAAVRASHDAAQAAAGTEAGSPVTAVGGRGFFGPVIAPDAAGTELDLFEAVRLLAGVPGFSELKRGRNPL